MKVSKLTEGMMLLVSSETERPVVRRKDPNTIKFVPDVFAQGAFGNLVPLNHKSYYMYLGKKTTYIPEEMRERFRGMKTYSTHELMDESGMVYKMHGRLFKYFEPVWRENDANV